MKPCRFLYTVLTAGLLVCSAVACAHTVSNAYLNVVADKQAVNIFHGQWDVSLRDLNFVLNLDDNGDGHITWGELKNHQPRIAKYTYAHLHFSDDKQDCMIQPGKQMVDRHAANGYAALFFDVVCPAQGSRTLTVSNKLLFAIDPTHRGIFVFRDRGDVATALFSPDNQSIKLDLMARHRG